MLYVGYQKLLVIGIYGVNDKEISYKVIYWLLKDVGSEDLSH